MVDLLHQRAAGVQDKLRQQFKNTKPFRMQEVSNDELLFYYNQLTQEQMMTLIQRHGRETISGFIGEMEQLKTRRQGNA